MPLTEFHPIVADWFQEVFTVPTEIQQKAWPQIKARRHTLIAAPTGSGKTLAAFYAAIDDLVHKGLQGRLMDETQVIYVSPLKALSNDIERNLQVPLRGISQKLKEAGHPEVKIKVAVRTGDTPQNERTAMTKNPPHILVTTPESLYLLLTSQNGRKILGTVHTAIIDEIHALVGDKRGSHLALSMERLERVTMGKLTRIGLSATQKPIETVAKFLTGNRDVDCQIIDAGHKRKLDLQLELPLSPLTAVMANEVWGEIYDRIEDLIAEHKTTLIFVNTRRTAERIAHTLTERLGDQVVTAHHGSMSREKRFDAEQRLKAGNLKALVATASLELGIDIGSVDLVLQIGTPKSIAAFLQRVGRSGHTIAGTPKGRLIPLSRDELVESVALFDAVRRGELDHIIMPEKPLDILAQQIVAEVACEDYDEDELFKLYSKAYPYRDITRKEYDEVVKMLSEGFSTRVGRRSAYLHRDMMNSTLRARKGARLTAIVSGGAIPDNFDYDVIMEPENVFVGTINEDFAIESLPGDIFQLGNRSYQMLKIETGKVRVMDANGLPPTIPFWFGEAPGRTIELSEAVSRLREEIAERVGDLSGLKSIHDLEDGEVLDESWKDNAVKWLTDEVGVLEEAADQVVNYLAAAKAALGVMPSHNTLVLERFFDQAGDMHMVVHSPFGSRLNRAWGLSLRKRFCKKFNFELQAAATEDAIILSLGASHSFPLMEVYDYLNPKSVRNVLIQALLDAPMFEIRWRWNASRALAVLRRRAGQKIPPQIQRSMSEDLVALIFPDQLACFENIPGEREVPDHPLVNQTIHDCLTEAMDIEELAALLGRIKKRELQLEAVDLREPSPLSAEILAAKPYAFLDDAPAEERRTNAVQSRSWMDPADAKELGKLDEGAIEAVKAEAWPQPSNCDELHDTLLLCAFVSVDEGKHNGWSTFLDVLIEQGRAVKLKANNKDFWVGVERIPQFEKVYKEMVLAPNITIPDRIRDNYPADQNALVEIIRSCLETRGPVTVDYLSGLMGLKSTEITAALYALENEGFVFRGHFTPDMKEEEWCERRLLARIHRYTLQKLRKEIDPVSVADYMRFLFAWHNLSSENKPEGSESLLKILEQLEGFEAQAASWESDLLPMRMKDYDYNWLDMLCLSGRTNWGKIRPNQRPLPASPKGRSQGIQEPTSKGKKVAKSPIKTTPISIVGRANMDLWLSGERGEPELSPQSQMVYQILKENGALFFHDLYEKSKLLKVQLEEAMSELVSNGLLTADSFIGLRALLVPTKYKSGRKNGKAAFEMEQAGRWSLIQPKAEMKAEERTQKIARILLKRYGVVFRKMVERESFIPPWRDLVRVYRIMEARGEIRGGRFVTSVYGEQFALPEAVAELRSIRRKEKTGKLISLSAADPLNLVGILTPGKRVASIYTNRILFMDGVPVAVKESKEIRLLPTSEDLKGKEWELKKALVQRDISPRLRSYLGKGIF